jgi:dimethylamine/trimethylamine dehydrogenase
MGGRVLFESALPGLSAWRRVIDYRLGRLKVMPNVELYPGSELDAAQILEFGFERVVLATGAAWAPALFTKMEIAGEELDHPNVFTPSDLAAGARPEGPVVVLDYDFHVMGGVLAERIATAGQPVTYVTPAGGASAWTINANEQIYVHQRLHELGVPIRTLECVSAFDGAEATLGDMLTDRETRIPCRSLVIVGLRRQNTGLYDALEDKQTDWADAGIRTVERTGDALSPGAIAHAVFYGRATAEAMDGPSFLTFRRDGPFHTPPERNGNAMIAAMAV